ncbi:uncharacterized protein DUF1826 [Sinobacterium caligoides]|uniref:Uncharacterized protein DUF1826 n=1 Tax=Sinobacterium caligoides TaxID=933926 RepID=A0A3N2DFU7_9GAMM|nr:DUF1826 domain-containing protein [Sinobacterium caligoides]ROR98680.1 uncharacterized protein DUF1826 [Sinobacterium caligoides]
MVQQPPITVTNGYLHADARSVLSHAPCLEDKSMSAIATAHERNINTLINQHAITGNHPEILTDIFRDDSNIVVWQRQLADALSAAVEHTLTNNNSLLTALTVTPQDAYASIHTALGATSASAPLAADMAQLVDMFCCLFDIERAGLRLTAIDRAMCPRFHVDHVPCRLVTTYQGVATEWLAEDSVDRSKLGLGSRGKADAESGIYRRADNIQRLQQGDVALLKGELWPGNAGAGLVHRSPSLSPGERRLFLSLDFVTY